MSKELNTLVFLDDTESEVFDLEYINQEFSQQINEWKESNEQYGYHHSCE